MNAIPRELSDRNWIDAAEPGRVGEPFEADLAARAAALRAYRLTRTALPTALPTKMPPQSFEFWTSPVSTALREWRRRLSGRRTLPGSADLGAG